MPEGGEPMEQQMEEAGMTDEVIQKVCRSILSVFLLPENHFLFQLQDKAAVLTSARKQVCYFFCNYGLIVI